MQAAEQIFKNKHDGYSNLIWLNHPTRSLIFVIHHTERWRGWLDNWDGTGSPQINGATRGFAWFLLQHKNIARDIGQAIGTEMPYNSDVEELLMPVAEWIVDTYESGWRITDSTDRRLYLNAYDMTWQVEHWGRFEY